MAAAEQSPIAWVDTNVMAEVYTFGDMFAALLRPGRVTPHQRRLRTQGSLWMAMAFCSQRATTVAYGHELWRTALRIAPPDTRLGLPTTAMFQTLVPGGLLEGWDRRETDEAAKLKNKERDRHMVQACRDRDMVLVSRDADAVEYARTLGVRAVSPEDYARDVIRLEDARRMFLSRLDAAVTLAAHLHVGHHLLRGLLKHQEIDRNDWLLAQLRTVVERYEGVWGWRWVDPEEQR